MKCSIAAATLAVALVLAGPASVQSLAASGSDDKAARADRPATDFSSRRIYRTPRRIYDRAYGPPPTYYGRPVYYRPYPYILPAPFPLGIGFGPYW
jgi:hypothetical protein